MKTLIASVAGLALAAAALPAQARQTSTFNWAGQVTSGHWIRIRNLNGEISVGAATGDRVEVTATKHWRRGDSTDVHFDVKKFGANDENVMVCALWFDNTSCDEQHYGNRDRNRRWRDNDNDMSVDFRVLVPKGVKVDVSTVNGAVFVDGATSEVSAQTVNGGVEVTSEGGPVNAETTNGTVRARMGRFDPTSDMSFSTVNGSVIAEFAGDLNGDLELSTVNGGITTDFEMTLSGRLDPKHMRAHIGKPGGPRIRLSTVNGSVSIRHR
jgi:hypothetical protein